MSEMLANHYFQLRNFSLAERLYEKLNTNRAPNLRVLKKLIICQTQTQKIEKALIEFSELISIDISIILNSNIKEDDCPCNDLIFKIESGEIKYITDELTFIALGILWAYCNIKTSLNYFKMALDENPKNQIVKNVMAQIQTLFNTTTN